MINQPIHTGQTNSQVEKATRIIIPLIAADIVVIILLFFLAVQTPGWQLIASMIVAILIAITMGVGYSSIRRGRVKFGIQIVLYVLVAAVLLNGIWFAGMGLAFAIGLAVVVFQVTNLALSVRETVTAMIVTIVVGLLLIAIDNFDLSFRLFSPQLNSAIPFISGLLGLVFAYQIYRNFGQFGLRGRLVISTILVATLGVIVVAAGVQYITQATLLREAGKNIKTQADSEGVLVGELLSRQLDTLQLFAFSAALQDQLVLSNEQYVGARSEIVSELVAEDSRWRAMDDNELQVRATFENTLSNELLSLQEQFSGFQTIIVTDQFGVVVAATERPEHYFLGNQSWWLTTYNHGLGQTSLDLVKSSVPSKQGIRISVPVFDQGTKQAIGILYGLTNFNGLADILEAAKFDETGFAEIAFSSRLELGVGTDVPFELRVNDESDILQDAENNKDGFISAVVDARDVIVSVGRVQTLKSEPIIDALDWRVVVFQDEDEVFSLVEAQRNLNVLLGAFVIIVAGVVAAFVGQRLADPILRLKETALLVEAGDLTARSPIITNDEIGQLASVFNAMTSRLLDTLEGLERRVAERTRIIEISAEVSRNLSTILDPEQLVQEVVTQVRSAFDYYHAQIYLWDEYKTRLVMAGGTGEAGAEMLARGHALVPGKGLVGRAAEMKLPVLIQDVTQEEGWLPNELLPLTKAETAVPILIGDEVIGVLDVQHSVVGGLGQQDVELIQAVANQFAIAYQNARNYSIQQKQAEYEAQINDIRFRIQETRDVDEALKVTIRELGRVLGASKTTVKMHVRQAENGHD